ncbi:hypothetical protein F3Y22_tig00002840pilonHSYRG00007 [Hibiscus syriacus]|uniref:Uncharacterized protein n=1 Tax=Hibiscus syriacus TaxID=106335 RepID=A0A6A3CV56_HIBSY|nr:hypothetical protein F3Y22_tig00002840pilonHSYRG00007 [Hibiscus syriacus]
MEGGFVQDRMGPKAIRSFTTVNFNLNTVVNTGICDKADVIQELEKGVEPNGADYDRRTALHLAASEGWTEVVVLLLEKGADVNSLDRWGRTPLSDARSFGHHEVCKILEARGGIDPVFCAFCLHFS